MALGAFLIFSGLKMVFTKDKESDPEKNIAVRLVRKIFPVSTEYDGQKFLTRLNGRAALTPLALVLVLVETTDLIFALDSIPAILRRHPRRLHRIHLECLCHPGAALAVLCAGGGRSNISAT